MAAQQAFLPANSILERTRILVSEVLQVPLQEVGPESSPDTIETWDSLQHLNLVLALEQEFGIQFTPEEMEELLSVQLIADLVLEKLGPAHR
ncbi:MAG: acyl carrier protein [Acidobacteriia bacterium]|nr:acyl carrier protein [Terriglobia bacterium]